MCSSIFLCFLFLCYFQTCSFSNSLLQTHAEAHNNFKVWFFGSRIWVSNGWGFWGLFLFISFFVLVLFVQLFALFGVGFFSSFQGLVRVPGIQTERSMRERTVTSPYMQMPFLPFCIKKARLIFMGLKKGIVLSSAESCQAAAEHIQACCPQPFCSLYSGKRSDILFCALQYHNHSLQSYFYKLPSRLPMTSDQ